VKERRAILRDDIVYAFVFFFAAMVHMSEVTFYAVSNISFAGIMLTSLYKEI
jgi:hypothetical protein